VEASAIFQQAAAAFEERYNRLEGEYQAELQTRLGTIEAEYQKLPDGEGTPDWAIKKGKDLMATYNTVYEALCAKYFSAPDALFKTWLGDFRDFLVEEEVPFTQKQLKMEYAQFGLEPDQLVANLMAVDKYLEKCAQVFNLRRSYPQG